MKHAIHLGDAIAYDIQGNGAPLVLQHGFLSGRQSWHNAGYVDAFTDRYTVITVDSLGHGDSDKPADPGRYARRLRAGDIAAVLDAEGIGRAHYVGYSMGGWIGSGVVQFHAERLLSATIGGWDPVGGMGSGQRVDLDTFLERAHAAAPYLTEWVTDAVKPGLAACLDALEEVDGTEAALREVGVPVLMWAGADDGCYAAAQALAARMDHVSFAGVPGDHVAARMQYVSESVAALSNFLKHT